MPGIENFLENSPPAEVEIALAYARAADRPAYRDFFALDRRLAEIISGSSETMIGQLRLAWWRDTLAKEVDAFPEGEPLLRSLAQTWGKSASELIALVDGWEALLVAETLERDTVTSFAQGRAEALAALASRNQSATDGSAVRSAANIWSMADLASHLSDDAERDLLLSLARTKPAAHAALGKRLRPLAVLAALGHRAVQRGGRPLMEGRGAALLALRVGALGR